MAELRIRELHALYAIVAGQLATARRSSNIFESSNEQIFAHNRLNAKLIFKFSAFEQKICAFSVCRIHLLHMRFR